MDGGIEGEMRFRMNEVKRCVEEWKECFKCRSLGMNAKRRLYEGR